MANTDVTVGGVTYRQDPATGAWFRYDAGTQGWAWSGAPPQTGGSGLTGTPGGGANTWASGLGAAPATPAAPNYGLAGTGRTAFDGVAGYQNQGGAGLLAGPNGAYQQQGAADPAAAAFVQGYAGNQWAGVNGQAGGWLPPQTQGSGLIGTPPTPTGVNPLQQGQLPQTGPITGPLRQPNPNQEPAATQPAPTPPDWRTQQSWWGTIFPKDILGRTVYDIDPNLAWNTMVNHNVTNSASPEYQWLQQQQGRNETLYAEQGARALGTPQGNMTISDYIEQTAPSFHNQFLMQNASVKGYANPFMLSGRFTG